MTTKICKGRLARARQILASGGVKINSQPHTYIVQSQNGRGKYTVATSLAEFGRKCHCIDHKAFGHVCKHIIAAELAQAETMLKSVLIQTEGLSYTKTLSRGCYIMLDGLRGNGLLLRSQLEGFAAGTNVWPRFAERIKAISELLEDKTIELETRLTTERAYDELFDHDSAIPVQHSRGRSKLLK